MEFDVDNVIEILRCAEVNCDNAPRLGMAGILIIKAQIQDAIKQLGGEIVSEDVLAPYREVDK
jgi:hypothetical protein